MENKFIIILAIIFSIFIAGRIAYLELREDYICDIGENKIAGDYKVEPDTFFNNRGCAIQDCAVFNNYQKEIGGEELCLV